MFSVVGFEWGLTLRELISAYEHKERTAWGHTSLICCILANANRDPAKQRQPFAPSDFNPYEESVGAKSNEIEINSDTFDKFVITMTGK